LGGSDGQYERSRERDFLTRKGAKERTLSAQKYDKNAAAANLDHEAKKRKCRFILEKARPKLNREGSAIKNCLNKRDKDGASS